MKNWKLIATLVSGAVMTAIADWALGTELKVPLYMSFAHKFVYMLWGGAVYRLSIKNKAQ